MIEEIKRLKKLYSESSKHSNYQILSKKLSKIIDDNDIQVKTRFEEERLEYILEYINIKNKSILDIGGNTGFFSFEMINNGANNVHYYEGNKVHSDFVRLSADILNIKDNIKISNEYFKFDEAGNLNKRYDLILLLNVLHHVGDDYGDKGLTIKKAKESIIRQLNSLWEMTEYIAFQLGFNWKGNKELGLFKEGTKEEMIRFIKKGVIGYWEIIKIGVAENQNGIIKYYDLNRENVNRIDQLGEFLNRPIFIMKSLR
ncbi:class I SAM-dependent methyltransferase [Bacillus sp. FJAT-49736]|uniref:class I SAM-dependent methyltransferase n=1 Tax=Bacillus sp. FJAT-49736 TaxID=2833582 RepID=UPI001BC9EF1F|nr:class I SAM-dependent methyltransferase [Bacillus sp. FJAT-49736]MBS4174153.1 methyltransferase domain-containing protein [Bacillus sp. FJAT-49736]